VSCEKLSEKLEQELRLVLPGHFQRGGEPTPTDRILCSRLGVEAGKLGTISLNCENFNQAHLIEISLGDD